MLQDSLPWTAGYLTNHSLINMPISQVSEAVTISELGAQVHVGSIRDVFSVIPHVDTGDSMWVSPDICP